MLVPALLAGSCRQAQLPALPTQLREQGAGGAGRGMPAEGCPGQPEGRAAGERGGGRKEPEEARGEGR